MSKLNNLLSSIEQDIHNLQTNKELDIDILKDTIQDIEKIKEKINELEMWLKSGIHFLQ